MATSAGGCGGSDVPPALAGQPPPPPLSFVVWGDVRPQALNDAGGYPIDIFRQLMVRAQATGAHFAVATGDYFFADGTAAGRASLDAQVDLLLSAERIFGGPTYHAQGNHECGNYSWRNCPGGMETAQAVAFQTRLAVSPSRPYGAFAVETRWGLAKFLLLAGNAWTAEQATWLEQTLAVPSAYTIVVRHHPPWSDDAPGVLPSEQILARNAITLTLYGHEHGYRRVGPSAMIAGHAGAPLSYGSHGFVWVEQTSAETLVARAIRAGSGEVIDTFTIATAPAGAARADLTPSSFPAR